MSASDTAGQSQRILRSLLQPQAYPTAPRKVDFLQTHISWLFFADERVYKVKKPVDFGFLDFSTVERRRHFCEEEVRLNRRLAPDVYLGVVPLSQAGDDRIVVNGDGPVIDWAVEMLRLPHNRMLSTLLDRGEIDNQRVHELVELLIEFHARAATGPEVDEYGTVESIRGNTEENLRQIENFVGTRGQSQRSPTLSETQYGFLAQRARSFLSDQREEFDERVRTGRIREGHGDLHADNICFPDSGPVAYDCIEFSRRFRCGDVASEVAFLAMDLDHRGYPAFSNYLVKRYAEATGDAGLRGLMGFYKAYRAVVRGKVASLTAADSCLEEGVRHELERKAMRYFQLAATYDLPPALVLTCGLPASGKSWLARRLARPLRAVWLRSDVRRKIRAGLAVHETARDGYGKGLYASDSRQATYRSLLEDTLDLVRSGHSVVVDATFSRRSFRAPFVDAAVRLDLPYFIVEVEASEELVRKRLRERESRPDAVSDADLEVYLRERDDFERPHEVPEGHALCVESGLLVPEESTGRVIDRMIELQS